MSSASSVNVRARPISPKIGAVLKKRTGRPFHQAGRLTVSNIGDVSMQLCESLKNVRLFLSLRAIMTATLN